MDELNSITRFNDLLPRLEGIICKSLPSLKGRLNINTSGAEKGIEGEDTNNRRVHFRIQQMPGCCAYGLIYNIHFCSDLRGSELMDKIIAIIERMVVLRGYPAAIMTTLDRSDYEYLNYVLAKRKWEVIRTGKNPNSGNVVIMWVKQIEKGS